MRMIIYLIVLSSTLFQNYSNKARVIGRNAFKITPQKAKILFLGNELRIAI